MPRMRPTATPFYLRLANSGLQAWMTMPRLRICFSCTSTDLGAVSSIAGALSERVHRLSPYDRV